MGDTITILEMLFEKKINYLPKRLRQWTYPATKIKKEIKIDLKSDNLKQTMCGDNPKLTLQLKIRNYSLIDLELDRILFQVLENSHTILQGYILKQYKIPKRNETDIQFDNILSSVQVEWLRKRSKPESRIETIHARIYFKLNSESIEFNAGI